MKGCMQANSRDNVSSVIRVVLQTAIDCLIKSFFVVESPKSIGILDELDKIG